MTSPYLIAPNLAPGVRHTNKNKKSSKKHDHEEHVREID